MKRLTLIAAILFAVASSAWAQSAPKPAAAGAQSDKTAACNKAAGDRKGDDRAKYIADCMKKK